MPPVAHWSIWILACSLGGLCKGVTSERGGCEWSCLCSSLMCVCVCVCVRVRVRERERDIGWMFDLICTWRKMSYMPVF
jgi:hypothetical protein